MAFTYTHLDAAIVGDADRWVASANMKVGTYTLLNSGANPTAGTARKVNTAGMAELLGYHTARAAKELKRDMETMILSNSFCSGQPRIPSPTIEVTLRSVIASKWLWATSMRGRCRSMV